MSADDFTIYNPQQVAVEAVVYLPGLEGVESKLLAAEQQWVIPDGVKAGQWVAFFNPENGALLAAALLPDNSTIAQLLLDMGISGLLRMNPQEPLTAANGLDAEVTARLQDAGAAKPQVQKLAPKGQRGSSATFAYAAKGQWLGFYDSDEAYITGTWAGSFSMVTLVAPQRFVIGNPYQVSPEPGPKAEIRLLVPQPE
jgi:hypothetical protein